MQWHTYIYIYIYIYIHANILEWVITQFNQYTISCNKAATQVIYLIHFIAQSVHLPMPAWITYHLIMTSIINIHALHANINDRLFKTIATFTIPKVHLIN